MKILCFSIMLLLLAVSNVNAQITYGVKGGLNLANFHGNVEDTKFLPNFNVGGFINHKLTDKLQIQPEILYQGMGAKLEKRLSEQIGNLVLDEKINETFNFNYISLPVIIRYFLVNGLFAEFGPQFSFAVSQKVKYEITANKNGVNETDSGVKNLSDYYNDQVSIKKFDFSLAFGTGYIWTNGIGLNFRYNYGANAFIEQDYLSIKKYLHAKNSVIMLGASYSFQ